MSSPADTHLPLPFVGPMTKVFVALFAVTACLASFGSLLVFCHVIMRKKRHTALVFMGSMAAADMLMGLVVIPTTVDTIVHLTAIVTNVACIAKPYFQLLSVAASSLTLLAIAYDRYRAIIRPMEWQLTARHALGVVAVIWVVCALYALRLFIQNATNIHSPSGGGPVAAAREARNDVTATELPYGTATRAVQDGDDITPDDDTDRFCDFFIEDDNDDLYYRVADFSFIFLMPLFGLLLLYCPVINKLWSKKKVGGVADTSAAIQGIRKRRKLVKMFTIIVTLFFLCWAPLYLVDIVSDSLELAQGGNQAEMDATCYLANGCPPTNRLNDSGAVVGGMPESVGPPEGEEDELQGAGPLTRLIVALMAFSYCWMSPLIYWIFNEHFRYDVTRLLLCKTKVSPGLAQGIITSTQPDGNVP